jgi:hypothetical protein
LIYGHKVPNAPCGVESFCKETEILLGFSPFLMHRVELKVAISSGTLTSLMVPNAPCGAENLELKEKGLNF